MFYIWVNAHYNFTLCWIASTTISMEYTYIYYVTSILRTKSCKIFRIECIDEVYFESRQKTFTLDSVSDFNCSFCVYTETMLNWKTMALEEIMLTCAEECWRFSHHLIRLFSYLFYQCTLSLINAYFSSDFSQNDLLETFQIYSIVCLLMK